MTTQVSLLPLTGGREASATLPAARDGPQPKARQEEHPHQLHEGRDQRLHQPLPLHRRVEQRIHHTGRTTALLQSTTFAHSYVYSVFITMS